MANGKEVTLITDAGQRRASLPLVPTDTNEAWRLAEQLAKSAIIPKPLRDRPADVLVLLLMGSELGIGPAQAVRSIHVIEGKPVASAELMVALCVQRRDVCRYFKMVNSTDKSATYETHRVGSDPASITFTLEDAKRAGLAGKDNWARHPAAMLRARASSALARATYPDLVQGLVIADEAEEVGTATLVQAPRTLSDLTQRLSIKASAVGGSTVTGAPLADEVLTPSVMVTPDEAAEISAAERQGEGG